MALPRTVDILSPLIWPAFRLPEGVEQLARGAALISPTAPAVPGSALPAEETDLGAWVGQAAARLAVEAEPVEVSYADVSRMLRSAAPMVVRLCCDPAGQQRFLLLAGARGRRVALIGADRRVRHVPLAMVRDAICAPAEALLAPLVEATIEAAAIPPERQAGVRRQLLVEQLGGTLIEGGWLLRPAPWAPFWRHLRLARVGRPLLAVASSVLAQQLIFLLSWRLIGQSALDGQVELAWLWAWALLLFTDLMLRGGAGLAGGLLGTRISALFRERLLCGTLNLDPDSVRSQGIGQFLGRVMEANTVNTLTATASIGVVVAWLRLFTAFWVLAHGVLPELLVAALAACVLATLLLGWRIFRDNSVWVDTSRLIAHELVERMVGHRTRLAQQDRGRWHEDEDRLVEQYARHAQAYDGARNLVAAMPRWWTVVGLTALAPAFVGGQTPPALLAVSLGGVLLAAQALQQILTNLWQVAAISKAWEQVRPLMRAAARPDPPPPVVLPEATALPPGATLLTARDLTFRYRPTGRPVFQGCDLQIDVGQRLLLEGPSGGGKSTLAAVLAGQRTPERGLLLLRGYDRHSLGDEAWRRSITVVPQFHENHVFFETFAFNLLMGRGWPPEEADLAEAHQICVELGLGELIERMPSGLHQMVGESGWHLSHGERSRMFIARALLQGSDIVIMDESFGALDPETMRMALACALRRARTLVVIAHP